MTDRQTPIFSSYDGMIEFWYEFSVKGGTVVLTLEIEADLKQFVEYALQYFDEYNSPRLKCEVLGHHLVNLQSILRELGETPIEEKICSHSIQRITPGKRPPITGFPSYFDGEVDSMMVINLHFWIREELERFPRLNFLEHTFDSYFDQIKKPLISLLIDPMKFLDYMIL